MELNVIDTIEERMNILYKINRIKTQLVDVYGIERSIIHKLIMEKHNTLADIEQIIKEYEKTKETADKSFKQQKKELEEILTDKTNNFNN